MEEKIAELESRKRNSYEQQVLEDIKRRLVDIENRIKTKAMWGWEFCNILKKYSLYDLI